MAKSPNGKIVKSLYLKIAYVWTKPYKDKKFNLNVIYKVENQKIGKHKK